MKQVNVNHPTEELLTEYALGNGLPEIGEHIQVCLSCCEYVEQMKLVRNAFVEIEEEDVPQRVGERIFKAASAHRKKGGMLFYLVGYHNRFPFLIGIITIFIVLLLYFLFMGVV